MEIPHQLRVIAETERKGRRRLLSRYQSRPFRWHAPVWCLALRLEITADRHRFGPGQPRINRLHGNRLERHDLAHALGRGHPRSLVRSLPLEITSEQFGQRRLNGPIKRSLRTCHGHSSKNIGNPKPLLYRRENAWQGTTCACRSSGSKTTYGPIPCFRARLVLSRSPFGCSGGSGNRRCTKCSGLSRSSV